uniref:CCHC-type domain-containing protein n=1 Tax=Tanacetum cinerariifolium TaxID=118510 RepID=A0A6L2LNQ3_TANCI|nr:hypothetical protein [Tanacetum cinerariifolium]
MALISTSFKIIYKPTNNNLRISSNTRNKNIDNTSRTERRTGYDRQTCQYENQRAVNVARNRDTVWNQVVRQTEIQCFICKEFVHVAKECKKAKKGIGFCLSQGQDVVIDIAPSSSNMSNDEGKVDQDTAQEEECALLCFLHQFKT